MRTDDNRPDKRVLEHPSGGHIRDADSAVPIANFAKHTQ
jgi:hypothetical protein